jgi:hypothetical protein
MAFLAFAAWQGIHSAFSMERVHFESARYLVAPLQRRLARERGETTERPAADVIDGYLTKPGGQRWEEFCRHKTHNVRGYCSEN